MLKCIATVCHCELEVYYMLLDAGNIARVHTKLLPFLSLLQVLLPCSLKELKTKTTHFNGFIFNTEGLSQQYLS